jgi:hypothetical protein
MMVRDYSGFMLGYDLRDYAEGLRWWFMLRGYAEVLLRV